MIAGSNAIDAPPRAIGLVFGDKGIHEVGRAALAADTNFASARGLATLDRVGDTVEIGDATAAFDTRRHGARIITK